jgi:excisionase family DNA binding protein
MLDTQTMQYLTAQEVAQHLRVNPVTIYRAIQRGELEAVRLGGSRLRVRPEAVGQFIESTKERT